MENLKAIKDRIHTVNSIIKATSAMKMVSTVKLAKINNTNKCSKECSDILFDMFSKAVQENQEGKYVYILDENELPKLVYIKVSGQDGDYFLVSEGLEVGQTVLTSGIQKVIPGTPVRIVEQEVIDKPETVKISFIQKIKNKINQIFKRGKN